MPCGRTGGGGAGKTSVLEALSLLGPGRGLRGVASEKLARRPLSHKVALVSPSESDEPAQGWSVVAELAGATGAQKVSLLVGADGRKRYLLDEEGVAANRLSRVLPLLWLTPAQVNLFSGGASLRTKFYDRLVLGFFPDQGTILNRANRLRQERRRLLVETAGRATGKQASWLDSLEAGLATETAAAEARRLAVGRCLLAPLADLRPPFCHLKLNFIGACQTADAKTLHTYAAALESPLATNQEVAPCGGFCIGRPTHKQTRRPAQSGAGRRCTQRADKSLAEPV